MVRAENPVRVGEVLLEQGNGPAQVAGRPVDASQVVAGDQHLGMVRAEDALAIGKNLLEDRDGPA